MRILYLAHRIPYPPNKGEKIRAFHEIQHLSRVHEIHLLAFYDYAEDLEHATALRQYCRSVTLIPLNPRLQKFRAALAILQGRPFSLGYFGTQGMRAAVVQIMKERAFDAVFVYCSSMAPYVQHVGIPRILDFVDSDASKWAQYARALPAPARWLYACEARRLKRHEIRMAERFEAGVFVSQREAGHFPEEVLGKLAFIQNGIDLDAFPARPKPPESQNIVFTGAMDYFPNVDAVRHFASDVFPAVRRRFPRARFIIVGSRPAPAVRELAQMPGVEVTGTVSDVRPYLDQARVAVVPLRISQGIQNKVLEAFAVGLPVVASPNAAAGLAPMSRVPLAVAGDPAKFAEAVIQFLERPPLSDAEVRACRQDLDRHYNWDRNLSAFDRILEQWMPAAGRAPAALADLHSLTSSVS